ncbi:MAG: hypothetical protein ACFFCS_06525 [Candidatus Hodarchaeota archaeon]
MLETPNDYLAGPSVSFYHGDEIKSESWRFYKNLDEDNPMEFVNLEIAEELTRVTLDFKERPEKRVLKQITSDDMDKIFRLYADMFFSKEKLKFVIFYTIKNISKKPMKDVRFYNLYDFDIGGLFNNDSDYAYFDDAINAIVQYNANGVHVGIGTVRSEIIKHYTAGNPFDLKISEHASLDDKILDGPNDLFVGLEISMGNILPGEINTIALIIASGETKEEFEEYFKLGKDKAKRLMPLIPEAIEKSTRNKPNDGITRQMNEILQSDRCTST